MGLFDIFKTKTKPSEIPVEQKVERPECDISKTQIMVDLFSVAKEARDDNWTKSFYDNVKTASYACGNPQVFNGPDGFPYFVLRTPEANKAFESFCIQNMTEAFLLEKGLGVALNPTETSVDYVFSYGDIVNLHINKELYTKTENVKIEKEVTIQKEEEVLVAQPSESYLPKAARQHLKTFLQSIGINQPQVMMLSRKIDGQIIQELAFNIFREDYQSTEDLHSKLERISWFLPRHYVIISLPKNSDICSSFEDL